MRTILLFGLACFAWGAGLTATWLVREWWEIGVAFAIALPAGWFTGHFAARLRKELDSCHCPRPAPETEGKDG